MVHLWNAVRLEVEQSAREIRVAPFEREDLIRETLLRLI